MPQRDLGNEEHFARQCPRKYQVRDEQGKILGVTAFAFALREGKETYLSGALFEQIDGTLQERLTHICDLWRAVPRDVRGNCAVAVCNAGMIRECGQRHNHQLRVRYEPSRENPAYAAVRRLPLDNGNMALLEALAAESVVSISLVSELDRANK